MHYKLTHHTWYAYSEPVPFCHNAVHLTPRHTPQQDRAAHQLRIEPAPDFLADSTDYFGNQMNYFAIEGSHRGLSVTAESEVEVRPPQLPPMTETPPWEEVVTAVDEDYTPTGLEVLLMRYPSPRIKASEEIGNYAASSFSPGRPILDAVNELNGRIHADFIFDPRATTVHTPLDEVMQLRRGVCQDFAHLTISCLRAMGLAARYVSGYICTTPPPGKPRLVGADASHAWVGVYCGQAGWIDIDPTNNMLVGDGHIAVAWGRDYGDICPIQGVFIGGGQHTMGVSVDVVPQQEFPQNPQAELQRQQQQQQ